MHFSRVLIGSQTPHILGYSPPDKIFKMAARLKTKFVKWTKKLLLDLAKTKSTCFVKTKTAIALNVGA